MAPTAITTPRPARGHAPGHQPGEEHETTERHPSAAPPPRVTPRRARGRMGGRAAPAPPKHGDQTTIIKASNQGGAHQPSNRRGQGPKTNTAHRRAEKQASGHPAPRPADASPRSPPGRPRSAPGAWSGHRGDGQKNHRYRRAEQAIEARTTQKRTKPARDPGSIENGGDNPADKVMGNLAGIGAAPNCPPGAWDLVAADGTEARGRGPPGAASTRRTGRTGPAPPHTEPADPSGQRPAASQRHGRHERRGPHGASPPGAPARSAARDNPGGAPRSPSRRQHTKRHMRPHRKDAGAGPQDGPDAAHAIPASRSHHRHPARPRRGRGARSGRRDPQSRGRGAPGRHGALSASMDRARPGRGDRPCTTGPHCRPAASAPPERPAAGAGMRREANTPPNKARPGRYQTSSGGRATGGDHSTPPTRDGDEEGAGRGFPSDGMGGANAHQAGGTAGTCTQHPHGQMTMRSPAAIPAPAAPPRELDARHMATATRGLEGDGGGGVHRRHNAPADTRATRTPRSRGPRPRPPPQ